MVVDGEVVSAIAEERLDRQKQSRVFPTLAIQRCLADASLEMADIDEVAVAWNPAIELETIPAGYLSGRRSRTEHLVQVPARLMQLTGGVATGEVSLTGLTADGPPITFLSHYDAHIGSSYFMSPWHDAAVLIMDGRGEKSTSLLARARGVHIDRLDEVLFPHSIGLFYGAITEFLGFKPDSDEWKVMALASFADPDNEYLEKMARLVRVDDDGRFELALEYFEFFNLWDRRMFSDRFVATFGPPRQRTDELEPRHERLAAAAQRLFEQTMAKILTALHERTGADRVAVSGGCFMNSVFNGKARDLTPFDEYHVSSAPDDSGTAIGAALFLNAQRTGERGPGCGEHNYWGPSYSDEQCLDVVRRYRLPNAEVVVDPSEQAAQDLLDGRIVGWFQGRMEFGQRALGNRSILLDPRRADGRDIVNSAVKFREGFRPFAPAILAERVNEWFECQEGAQVPFMERVFPFKKDKAEQVPAVVHVDGTGRLQTVEARLNPRFHALIEAFDRRCGVPIVLNTSFNLNGEPVVCSPDDALRTFSTCALDVLYLGNVRLAK